MRPFSFFSIGVAVLFIGGTVQAQSPYANTPQELIKLFWAFNGACRGSNDAAKVKANCENRSIVSAQLEGKNWCLLPKEAPTSHQQWKPCQSEYDHSWWFGYTTNDGRRVWFDSRTIQDTWQPGFHRLVNADVIDSAGKVQRHHLAFDCAGKYKFTSAGNGNALNIPKNSPLDIASKVLCLDGQANP